MITMTAPLTHTGIEAGSAVAVLETIVADTCILATNTSSISVTRSVHQAYFGDPRFTPSVQQQEMVDAGFLGRKTARGFYRYGDDDNDNDILFDLALDYGAATRIALARADQCGDAAWNAAVGLFQGAGFTVSRIDDVPGMVVMRTVAMLANEAADAVNQGVCSASAVDIAMRKGVNYPRGPLAWTDAIGVRQVVTVLSNLAASYGEERYRVSPLLRRKLASLALAPAGARFHA